MFHTIAIAILAFILVNYISYETKKPFRLKQDLPWLIAAVILPLIASVLSNAVGNKMGNFLLHTIGGGMASACLFFYVCNMFEFKLNWRLQIIALFAFVTCLGVMNELLEFTIELTTPLIMSLDTQDTWRDLVANTTGSLIVWIIVTLTAFSTSRKQG